MKLIKDVHCAKDVFLLMDSHSWKLTSIEQYGEPLETGDTGIIASMKCEDCNAECGVMILPSGLEVRALR